MARIIVQNAQEFIRAIQEEISHNQNGRYMHRLHVVLFVLQGNSCTQASQFFGDAPRAIQYWLHRLISNGLNGLKDKPIPGRQSQLSPDQIEQLQGEISQSPRDLGYDQNIWTGALLSHHLSANYAVKIDVRQCQRLFHQLGFSLQRPRRKPYESDPAEQAEFKRKYQALVADPNAQVWCEDEVHFGRYATLIRTWSPKGEQPSVVSASTRQNVGFFGVVNVKTGQLLTRESKVFNGANFLSFVRSLVKQTKGKNYLILDNARWHSSKELKDYLAKHKRKLVCVYLPPYSPELNPVERVWKMTRKIVTHNRFFSSVFELARALVTFFLKLIRPNETLKTLCANI